MTSYPVTLNHSGAGIGTLKIIGFVNPTLTNHLVSVEENLNQRVGDAADSILTKSVTQPTAAPIEENFCDLSRSLNQDSNQNLSLLSNKFDNVLKEKTDEFYSKVTAIIEEEFSSKVASLIKKIDDPNLAEKVEKFAFSMVDGLKNDQNSEQLCHELPIDRRACAALNEVFKERISAEQNCARQNINNLPQGGSREQRDKARRKILQPIRQKIRSLKGLEEGQESLFKTRKKIVSFRKIRLDILQRIFEGIFEGNEPPEAKKYLLTHEIAEQEFLELDNLDNQGKSSPENEAKRPELRGVNSKKNTQKKSSKKNEREEKIANKKTATEPVEEILGCRLSMVHIFKLLPRITRWNTCHIADVRNFTDSGATNQRIQHYLDLSNDEITVQIRRHQLFGLETLLSSENKNFYWFETVRGPAFLVESIPAEPTELNQQELCIAYIGINTEVNRSGGIVYHAGLVPITDQAPSYEEIKNIGAVPMPTIRKPDNTWSTVGAYTLEVISKEGLLEIEYVTTKNRIRVLPLRPSPRSSRS